MKVHLLKEAGLEEALLGMALSYYDHAEPLETWWDDEKKQRAYKRATSLAFRGGGHNKFLESIQVWVFVQGSRGWWSEMDTYRVGTTKQSASTMHTLSKRLTTAADYEEGASPLVIGAFNTVLAQNPDITTLKSNLPEGWLQERVICTNYKCLQNIVAQRHNHRLRHWHTFCTEIVNQVQHPRWLWQD